MIVRFANRMLAGTVFFVAAAVVISVLPTAADSFDNNMNSAGTGINRAPPHSVSASPAENTSVGNAVWAIPLSKLSMTRDRPIFSPSRRPPPTLARPTIAKPAEPTEPERPPLTLVGTVAGENSGIAVFVEQTTEKIVKLHMNESHEGWILRSVQGREVTLQNGRKSSVLALAPPGASPEPARAQVSLEPTRRPPRR
jgi:hypothetical protein